MTYEFITADGRSCCKSDRLENLCESCRAEALADIPPDPYAAGIAVLRAAAATPETIFAATYAAARAAEFAEQMEEESR